MATLGEMGEDDIETRALRRQQADRAETERTEADAAPTEEETATHERRADKAEYLRQKLQERSEAERDADA